MEPPWALRTPTQRSRSIDWSSGHRSKLHSLKVDPIFSFLQARGTQEGPGGPRGKPGGPREPWVPLPWLSPGSPWPCLGAPGLPKKNAEKTMVFVFS